MKKTLNIIFFMLLSFSINAQDWQTSFDKAQKTSSKESKPIVLVFQGSDWCAPCIKLDRQVWNTDAFKAYAKKHYVMLRADFPKKKKHALSKEQTKANAKLFEVFNKNGVFPFVVVLDSKGKVLGETSYKKSTPENYIKGLNSFIK